MTEEQLRQDLKQTLALEGWQCWFSPRVKFLKQQDIFGMWDFAYARGKEIRLGQFTTKNHRADHIYKIGELRKLYDIWHEGYLWLWDKKQRKWLVEKV